MQFVPRPFRKHKLSSAPERYYRHVHVILVWKAIGRAGTERGHGESNPQERYVSQLEIRPGECWVSTPSALDCHPAVAWGTWN